MSKLIVTPEGIAQYPHLQTADTRFNDNGLFHVRLHVSESDYTQFKESIDALYDQEYKKACTIAGKELEKADSTPLKVNDEGKFEIYAKQESQKMTKTKGLLKFRVASYNAQGTKIKMPPVGGGSTLKLAVEPYFWVQAKSGFGMTLRLRSVQILDLVELGSADNIFGAVDGGFSGGESFDLSDDDAETTKPADGNFSF